MRTDVSDSLIKFADPLGPGPHLFRRKVNHLRWFATVSLFVVGAIVVLVITIGFVEDRVLDFWYVLPPCLILAAGLLFRDLYDWRRMEFCPSCEALIRRPLSMLRRTYCANCGILVEPAKILLGLPGTFDLCDERNNNDSKPMVKLLTLVFLLAVKDRATEVRFEPGADQYRLRYRCDGVFYDMMPPPLHLHRAISDTLKALAGLSLEADSKQSGLLQIRMDDHVTEAIVCVEPAAFGENVIVQIEATRPA